MKPSWSTPAGANRLRRCVSTTGNPPASRLDMPSHSRTWTLSRLQERGWELVRRPTGGRAILHTDELTYSCPAPASERTRGGFACLKATTAWRRHSCGASSLLGLAAQMKAGAGRRSPLRRIPFALRFRRPTRSQSTARNSSAQLRPGAETVFCSTVRCRSVEISSALPMRWSTRMIEARREAARRLDARATSVAVCAGRVVTWHEAAAAFVRGFEEALGLRFERAPLSESRNPSRPRTCSGEVRQP